MKNMACMMVVIGLALGMAGPSMAGEPGLVTLQALMIQAQHEEAPIDRRLDKVEFKLRRVFGFPHYQYVGEGSITLPARGQGVIDLPNGHRLRVQLSGGRGSPVEVRWLQEKRPLLSTSVAIPRDAPVVLGGVSANGGKLILVLSAP